MFNPRPSSGISHSFSKSSSKVDSLNRGDTQTVSSLEQPANQNLQESTFSSSKFRSEFSGLSKKSDDFFRDTKPKQSKNLLDFDSNYMANTSSDQLFAPTKSLEATNDGVFEKNYLLKLMFTFERMSKTNSRKFVSEPLHFRSVDISSTYREDSFFDKTDKMKKLLYKQNPKRSFFDNQTRLLKGARGFPMKGLYREEDGDHDSPDSDKAFEAFDMRKMGDSVKYDDSFKEGSKDSRPGLTMDLVMQLSRESKLDLTRGFEKRSDANDVSFTRDSGSGDLSKFNREGKSSEMDRMFTADLNSSDVSRPFKGREEASTSELVKHLSGESLTGELSRHLSHESSRESLIESLKSVHSWDADEPPKPKSNFMKGASNMHSNTGSFTSAYKEYQSKDLLKEVFNQSSSFFKDKEAADKDESHNSFLERLLDKSLEKNDAQDADVLKFAQNFVETPRKMWNDMNLQWQYMDPQGLVHGPFSSDQMYQWYLKNFFPQNLRMRYNTKMAWTPFKDLFPGNAVPFKSLPAQFNSINAQSTASTMAAKPAMPASMSNKLKDAWNQTTTNNLLSSPNSTFSSATKASGAPTATNLLAPGNLLSSNTSLLGPPTSTTSLLGSATNTNLLGSSTSNTNLLAPSNLLGTNSLLNPTPNPLLAAASSPALLGSSAPATSTSLLGPGAASPALLGSSSNSATSSLLNNRLDSLWNNSQATVHPISSMSNIHMGVSNLAMNALPHASKNQLNKHVAASNHLTATPALNKQMASGNHVHSSQALNQFSVNLGKDFSTGGLSKDFTLAELNKQHSSGSLGKQYPASANNLKKSPFSGVAATVSTSVTTSATSTAARASNERKWNAPQVEVSSLLEIMELEKKSAQERSLKSPPKPVQTGWNLSNVATNNMSESDDFPSLSTVTTASSNSGAANTSMGKKFGKHITMPLETFIEKHQYTSPPKLTESFSSKLLGNKH